MITVEQQQQKGCRLEEWQFEVGVFDMLNKVVSVNFRVKMIF